MIHSQVEKLGNQCIKRLIKIEEKQDECSNDIRIRLTNIEDTQESTSTKLNAIYKKISSPEYELHHKLQNTYLSYHPDSQAHFNSHPEFEHLFSLFTAENKINNIGDVSRLWSFILNIKQIISEGICGDFAELGVWKGNTASILAYFASENNRRVYLFDTYNGFHEEDLVGIDSNKEKSFSDTSITTAKSIIGENSNSCEFVKGVFPESITELHKDKKYSVVSLDCDLYIPMKAGLNFFYPLMPKGGLFMLHDYSSLFWEGSKKAIDEFCKNNKEHVILMPDKSGSAFIRKSI
jgi:hypothetical protein